MASTSVLLLQLLMASLAAASHFFGGSTTYSYKGQNPDGSLRVDIRSRETFDGCQYSLYWNCYQSHCGYIRSNEVGVIDRSTNAPRYNRQWAASCCWVAKRNGSPWWRLQASLDLGSRSDTGKPNRSPDVAILPLLR
ncbi:hypothetical protein EYF80_060666 [Liparis tanakae]|uniref:Uncharacterized protein n=1 Tax=Liparis tanakae TaxID=230148 RepID=A0A4Z2EJZ6_9TELE|nr:hypothetical protein EYF80_060666 [Liparis tanakae]